MQRWNANIRGVGGFAAESPQTMLSEQPDSDVQASRAMYQPWATIVEASRLSADRLRRTKGFPFWHDQGLIAFPEVTRRQIRPVRQPVGRVGFR